MLDAMPKMTIAEMGETISINRYVIDWASGGEMRSMGMGRKRPSSALERSAGVAFDAAASGYPGYQTTSGIAKEDRDQFTGLMESALRIAIVDERVRGADGGSDIDRARLILVSMAMVAVARDQADGVPPSELENPVLEAARRKSGIEASAFSREDAHALGVGMADLIKDPIAARQVVLATENARSPLRDDYIEARIEANDRMWSQYRARPDMPAVSAAKGSLDVSAPQGQLLRAAADRSDGGR